MKGAEVEIQTDLTTEPDLDSAPIAVACKVNGMTLTTKISGELDLATASVLLGALKGYKGRYDTVSYELANLTFIDCAGLSALLTPVNGDPFSSQISIASPSESVRRLLELLNMQSIINDEVA